MKQSGHLIRKLWQRDLTRTRSSYMGHQYGIPKASQTVNSWRKTAHLSFATHLMMESFPKSLNTKAFHQPSELQKSVHPKSQSLQSLTSLSTTPPLASSPGALQPPRSPSHQPPPEVCAWRPLESVFQDQNLRPQAVKLEAFSFQVRKLVCLSTWSVCLAATNGRGGTFFWGGGEVNLCGFG